MNKKSQKNLMIRIISVAFILITTVGCGGQETTLPDVVEKRNQETFVLTANEKETDGYAKKTEQETSRNEAEKLYENTGVEEDSSISSFGSATVVGMQAEECMKEATHIIEAIYIGVYKDEYGEELMFQPVELIKGILDEDDKETIYVTLSVSNKYKDSSALDGYFLIGESYLLCLYGHRSVVYNHTKFGQIGAFQVSKKDVQWDEYYQLAIKVAGESTISNSVVYTGNPFITTSNLNEIIDFATNIFVIYIDDISGVSSVNPSTLFECTVIKELRNKAVTMENGRILLTLPNGMANVGERYLVLLADCSASAPVYTLAAKQNAVFSMDEVAESPLLLSLLQETGELTELPR